MLENPVQRLSEAQCWELLGLSQLGRLATSALGVVGIRPLNYVVDEQTIVFRTAPGAKLLELSVSSAVAFEIDNYGPESAWSVVATGHASIVTDPYEIMRVERLPLFPWVETEKNVFVRITVADLTGRSFVLGGARAAVI